jgi:hypothetical protein
MVVFVLFLVFEHLSMFFCINLIEISYFCRSASLTQECTISFTLRHDVKCRLFFYAISSLILLICGPIFSFAGLFSALVYKEMEGKVVLTILLLLANFSQSEAQLMDLFRDGPSSRSICCIWHVKETAS